MASRIIAPSSETRSAGRLKLFWLMVPMPNRGESKNPASKAPIIPTTIIEEYALLGVCAHDEARDPPNESSDDQPQYEIHFLASFWNGNFYRALLGTP